MRLNVIIPTLNRCDLLSRALASLLAAPVPPSLDVLVTVVNNNCTDGTRALVDAFAERYPGRVQMVFEARRGKSRALNAGIAATTGELVGMIDDDETIDPRWFDVIAEAFADPSLDYIGGPYVPEWEDEAPAWLPHDYLAVLGAVDNGKETRDYTPEFPGILKGGNAVIRRRVLQAVGPYAEHLGPAGAARLLSCEDEELYHRLLKSGARGRYLPSLVIHHYVPSSRLTPEYYRKWCFWRGVSRGLMDRTHPLPVPYLAGVPRFLFGRAVRGLVTVAGRAARRESWQSSFSAELTIWDLAGYWWGRHIYTLARFSPVRSRRGLNPSSAVNR